MTLALLALAALLGAFLAYRIAKFPGLTTKSVGAPLRLIQGGLSDAIAKGDQTTTAQAATLEKPLTERTAADWYDPNTEEVEMTFNEYGFITSPSPLPVNPFTSKTILTDGDVYDMQVAMGVTVDNPVDPLPVDPGGLDAVRQ